MLKRVKSWWNCMRAMRMIHKLNALPEDEKYLAFTLIIPAAEFLLSERAAIPEERLKFEAWMERRKETVKVQVQHLRLRRSLINPRRLKLFALLLPAKVKERIFDPEFADILVVWELRVRSRSPGFRRWAYFCIAVRSMVLYFACLRVWALAPVMDVIRGIFRIKF